MISLLLSNEIVKVYDCCIELYCDMSDEWMSVLLSMLNGNTHNNILNITLATRRGWESQALLLNILDLRLLLLCVRSFMSKYPSVVSKNK